MGEDENLLADFAVARLFFLLRDALFQVALYVADAFLLEDLLDGDHQSGLLHIAKLVIDTSSESPHGRGEGHVGVDERRNVPAEFPYLLFQYGVVLFVIFPVEDGLHVFLLVIYRHRFVRIDQVVTVREIFLHKVEDHVPCFDAEGRVHGGLAEEVVGGGDGDHEGAESVPNVV